MEFREIRKKLNDYVREWGNNKWSVSTGRGVVAGFGNVLTAEVNFRKIGAVTGALLPGVAFGILTKDPLASVIVGIMPPIPVISSYIGYNLGEKIDRLVGNNSPRGGLYGLLVKE